jgi:tetratricopeptide (TPR) repeat protein
LNSRSPVGKPGIQGRRRSHRRRLCLAGSTLSKLSTALLLCGVLSGVARTQVTASAPVTNPASREAGGSPDLPPAPVAARPWLAGDQLVLSGPAAPDTPALRSGRSGGEEYSARGIELYREHKPARSLDAFSTLLRFRQPNAEELRFVGLDYVSLEDLVSADEWLHASLQLDKTEWRTWRYLGGVQYSEEKVPEAIESFRQCLRLDPGNALAEDGLARSLDAQGKSAEAAGAYQLAVTFNAKDHMPSYLPPLHYGTYLLRLRDLKGALKYLSIAKELGPADADVHEALSNVFRATGDLKGATAEMCIAAGLSPEKARLHFILAQLYRAEGKDVEMKREIATYIDLSKQHPDDPDR